MKNGLYSTENFEKSVEQSSNKFLTKLNYLDMRSCIVWKS